MFDSNTTRELIAVGGAFLAGFAVAAFWGHALAAGLRRDLTAAKALELDLRSNLATANMKVESWANRVLSAVKSVDIAPVAPVVTPAPPAVPPGVASAMTPGSGPIQSPAPAAS